MSKKQEKATKKLKQLKGLARHNEKRQLVAKERMAILGRALEETDKLSARKLARLLKVSRMTAWRLLENKDGAWDNFFQKKKKLLDSASIEVMEKLLSVIKEGRLSPPQAGVVFGILSDKVYPPQTTQVLSQIRVGERTIKVIYPNFHSSRNKN